jgi:hypothetical protein
VLLLALRGAFVLVRSARSVAYGDGALCDPFDERLRPATVGREVQLTVGRLRGSDCFPIDNADVRWSVVRGAPSRVSSSGVLVPLAAGPFDVVAQAEFFDPGISATPPLYPRSRQLVEGPVEFEAVSPGRTTVTVRMGDQVALGVVSVEGVATAK